MHVILALAAQCQRIIKIITIAVQRLIQPDQGDDNSGRSAEPDTNGQVAIDKKLLVRMLIKPAIQPDFRHAERNKRMKLFIPIRINNIGNKGTDGAGIQRPGNGLTAVDNRMLAGQNKLAARADIRVCGFCRS